MCGDIEQRNIKVFVLQMDGMMGLIDGGLVAILAEIEAAEENGYCDGTEWTITTKMMSQREIDNLSEFDGW